MTHVHAEFTDREHPDVEVSGAVLGQLAARVRGLA